MRDMGQVIRKARKSRRTHVSHLGVHPRWLPAKMPVLDASWLSAKVLAEPAAGAPPWRSWATRALYSCERIILLVPFALNKAGILGTKGHGQASI